MNLKRITLDDTVEETVNKINENSTDIEENVSRLEVDFISYKDNIALKTSKIEKELNDYKATMQQVNINQEPKQKATGYGVVSLPKNAANGQVSSRLLGQSVTNLLGGEGDNSWTLPARPTSGTAPIFFDNLNLPQDKYLIFYELVTTLETFTLNTPYYNIVDITTTDPDHKTKNNTVGRKVWKLDAPETITKIGWRVYNTESEVRVKNFMVVKATEEDWHLTEGELIQKYNWHNGTKSTVGAVRIKSVGKNLFGATLEDGAILDGSGNNGIVPDRFRTKEFIKTAGNTQYVISGIEAERVYFYDRNKNYIGYEVSPTSFMTPANCRYVRFRFVYSQNPDGLNTQNIQLERNGTATKYEPYKESNAYVIATDKDTGKILELRSLPNGTKDEIRVADNKLIKRVSDEVVIKGDSFKNPVVSANVNEFVQIRDNGEWVSENNVRAGVSDWGIATSDDGNYKVTTAYESNRMVGVVGVNNHLAIRVEWDKVQSMMGSNNREKILNYLNRFPITLTYQLAEPIEIPVQVSGTLTSYPNGTVYIEPFIADAGVYTDKIKVLHDALPIKAIEKVSKVDFMTGVETELDMEGIVIAENKLSFTHPDLSDGDIVFFEYEYDREGTTPETEIEYYDSRYVIKDSVTDKFYKWHIIVADGVPSIELVEV